MRLWRFCFLGCGAVLVAVAMSKLAVITDSPTGKPILTNRTAFHKSALYLCVPSTALRLGGRGRGNTNLPKIEPRRHQICSEIRRSAREESVVNAATPLLNQTEHGIIGRQQSGSR